MDRKTMIFKHFITNFHGFHWFFFKNANFEMLVLHDYWTDSKKNALLISTFRELFIALCFESTWVDTMVESSRWSVDNFGISHKPPQQYRKHSWLAVWTANVTSSTQGSAPTTNKAVAAPLHSFLSCLDQPVFFWIRWTNLGFWGEF